MVATHSSRVDAHDIAARIDVRQLAEHLLGGLGKRSGKTVIFSNPNIEQRTPSFTVYANGYNDFATGEHGDVFGLIMLATRCDFPAALQYAAAFAGIVPGTPHLQVVRPATPIKPPVVSNTRWRQVAGAEVKQAAAYLYGDTPDARAALSYLHDMRGLTDQTIQAAQLGYNPAWRKTGYIKPDGKPAYLAPGIVIPWRDETGDLSAVRVRCRVGNLAEALDITPDREKDGNPLSKYISFSGSTFGGIPYGLLTPGVDVLIVEGEFDALIAAQQAVHERLPMAVMTAGSASGSLAAEYIERLQAAPRVLLALDNDTAGANGKARLLDALYNANVYTAAVPDGKDISDYLTGPHGTLAEVVLTAQRTALPDTWRVALNTFIQPTVAPVIDLYLEACRAGLCTEADGITAGELLKHGQTLGRHLSETTIRRGLAEGAKGGFFAILPTCSLTKKNCSILTGKIANNLGGRPVVRYQLVTTPRIRGAILAHADPRLLEKHLPPDVVAPIRAALLIALGESDTDAEIEAAELRTRYGIQLDTDAQRSALEAARLACRKLRAKLRQMHSTPLPSGWRYTNAAEYHAVYARAVLVMREGEQLSRAELAAKVGVSARSVYDLLAKAGLRADPRYAEQAISNAIDLSQVAPRYSREQQGYAKSLTVDGSDYRLDQADSLQAGKAAARLAIDAGRAVVVRYQQRSELAVASASQPPPLAKRERIVKPRPPSPVVREATQAPPVKPFYGTGPDPRWAEAQLVTLLHTVSAWRRQGDQLLCTETGELAEYSVKAVLAILLDRPPPLAVDVKTACGLHSEMCLAERASRIAGHAAGVGRQAYLSKLEVAEREAVLRFADGEEW